MNTTKKHNSKPNIINEKVNEYIEIIKDNFYSNINIETKSLNNGNKTYVDYTKQGQSVLSSKAKDLVNNLKRRVFKTFPERL